MNIFSTRKYAYCIDLLNSTQVANIVADIKKTAIVINTDPKAFAFWTDVERGYLMETWATFNT